MKTAPAAVTFAEATVYQPGVRVSSVDDRATVALKLPGPVTVIVPVLPCGRPLTVSAIDPLASAYAKCALLGVGDATTWTCCVPGNASYVALVRRTCCAAME